jgi:hypothetical protein
LNDAVRARKRELLVDIGRLDVDAMDFRDRVRILCLEFFVNGRVDLGRRWLPIVAAAGKENAKSNQAEGGSHSGQRIPVSRIDNLP